MRENYKPAPCHPERRHAAKGLCFPCYNALYPKAQRATCHPDRIAHTGGMCRVCYEAELNARLPDYAARKREICNAWRDQNKKSVAARQAAHASSPRVRQRVRKRARDQSLARFGLTREDEQHLLLLQGGGCAICGAIPDRAFDLDHCHNSQVVRGLLCGKCNKGIGLLGDSAESVRRALLYLQDPPGLRLPKRSDP